MKKRLARFMRRLHADESGMNTVETILLLVVAIIVLIAIYKFVEWAFSDLEEKQGEIEQPDTPNFD